MKKFFKIFSVVLSLVVLVAMLSATVTAAAPDEIIPYHTHTFVVTTGYKYDNTSSSYHTITPYTQQKCSECGYALVTYGNSYQANHSYSITGFIGTGTHSGKSHTWDCWYGCVCGSSYRGQVTYPCSGDGINCPRP